MAHIPETIAKKLDDAEEELAIFDALGFIRIPN
jgi:hypothetical protein